MYLFTLITFSILLSHALFAESVNRSRLGLQPYPVETNSTSTTVGFDTTSYLNSSKAYFSEGASEQDIAFRLDFNARQRFYKGTAVLNVSDELSTTEQANYLIAREAYVKLHQGNIEVSLGRKLDNWAQWESNWKQGLFQPRYMHDRLLPEIAGLTGFFYRQQVNRLAVTAGLLPIYIPDFGPKYATENASFTSKSPWFHAPSDKFIFNGQPGKILYSVNEPSVGSVIAHPGAVAKVEYDFGSTLSRVSAAYKPISSFAMGFPSENQLVIGGEMNVQINPRIIYSRTVNFDQVYARGLWMASASVAFDSPLESKGPRDWTAQQFAPAWIYSGELDRAFGESRKAAHINVGFLKVVGGDAADTGRFSDQEKTRFERRFQYHEAYSLGVTQNFEIGAMQTLSAEARAIYDPSQNGGVFQFKSSVNLDRNWRAQVAMNFLGLLSESKAKIGDGFLASYRANDSISAGVTYVY